MSFVNKSLTHAHMKKTHLQNQSLKSKCKVNRINLIKQRNYCLSRLKKN